VSATVLYMSMSLDGFVAGPNEDPDRLHEWYFAADADRTALNSQVIAEFMATGAVVAGRGTFEPASGWGGDHHDGVPIWSSAAASPAST
jgi:dihydrofolate reductase